jgi:hypothetical protein
MEICRGIEALVIRSFPGGPRLDGLARCKKVILTPGVHITELEETDDGGGRCVIARVEDGAHVGVEVLVRQRTLKQSSLPMPTVPKQ